MGGSDGKAKTMLVPPVTTKEKRIFIEREDALQSSLKWDVS